MKIPARWHASFEFACHDPSCRPPGSGGTGGSSAGVTAASFARRVMEKYDTGNEPDYGVHNAWLHSDGSVEAVAHHEDGDGYTKATLEGRVRIIATPKRSELTVDGSLMSHGLSVSQMAAVHVLMAQTKAQRLYLGGHHMNSAMLQSPSRAEVDKVLAKLPEVERSEQRQGD